MIEAGATETRLIAFVHLTALPAWLALSHVRRQRFVAECVDPVLAAHTRVSVRWIDVEAFTAESSDVLLGETDDVRQWNHFMEALRDTPLFTQPLFRLDRIVIGIEDGHRDYLAGGTDTDNLP